MVAIKKLTQEEASQTFSRASVTDLTEYVDALKDLSPGDSAEVADLDPTERRKTVRRFNKAADQLGYKLKWSHGEDGRAFLRISQGTNGKH